MFLSKLGMNFLSSPITAFDVPKYLLVLIKCIKNQNSIEGKLSQRITLIPQHYYKLNFLSTWATKSCPGFCHVEEFTYLSVAKEKFRVISKCKIFHCYIIFILILLAKVVTNQLPLITIITVTFYLFTVSCRLAYPTWNHSRKNSNSIRNLCKHGHGKTLYLCTRIIKT